MTTLPPLPRGYRLEQRPDPWSVLKAEGFEATNGYRTPADVQRIRAQGYSPAPSGAHNRGDGVDLTHPKLSAKQQERRLRELAQQNGWGNAVVKDEGHHRHIAIPGWGAAPGTPGTSNSGLPPIPRGFELVQRGSLAPGNFVEGSRSAPIPSGVGRSTGRAIDGDTLGLSTGRNARLSGLDAWELGQQGRQRDGSMIPLGANAKDALTGLVSAGKPVFPTGDFTFGRPVVNLGPANNDPAAGLLRGGHALTAPEFLKGNPRFAPYMEAERQARMNLLGGHGTNAETPEQFRGKDGPWQGMEPGKWGEGQAVFGDEPSPFYGLRPEIEQGYLAIWQDMASKPEDLIAYANASGFEVDPATVRARYDERNKPKHHPTGEVSYMEPPRPLTDPGDGKLGTTLRGVGDPFNMIDELGGVADALGVGMAPDGPRETIWNSDRRFGDILHNNIDQNRSVLAHDDATHPYYRLGGQVASGVALPYGAGVRTVAGLSKLGATEGFLAGFGAGEGGIIDRAPSALVGTALGAGGGYALGKGAQQLRRLNDFRLGRTAYDAELSRRVAPEMPQAGAAMRMEDEGAELVGPVAPVERERDYLDLPPLPPGFALDQPFDAARRMDERLSPEQMAHLADGVDPRSVLPRPGNAVESLEEAMRANPGPLRDLEAPDPLKELGVRRIPSARDLYKHSNIRGPIDITQSIRMLGGVRDEGGDLASMGITNAPRRLAFGGNEQFLGKVVDNERGMSLDEATERLWEEGYFPEFGDERPTINDLLNRLDDEARGIRRYFHPDDAEEVARFESAQSQRYRIEEAANSGSPLADDIGESITLDDLVANTPPAEAYEEMPRLVGKVGNINLAHIEKSQDVAQLIGQIQQRVGGFSAANRGRVTNEETRRLAQEIGLRPEDLLKRRQGQALNAEQLYATRVLVQKSREVVANLARKAVGGADEDVARFRNAWLRHVAIEEQVSGSTAEAGRALQQFNMLARGGDARAQAVRAYLKGAGGRESIEDAAQAIVDLMEDPAKASHFMREAVKPRWRDKFNELWINSLLSGPKTHVVNFVGNSITAMMSLPEQALTAGIGKVLGSTDRALIGEVGARLTGMGDSAVDALKAAKRGFITGEPSDAVSKVEAANYHAIGGRVGQVIRTPTRALTAADEFWKTINSGAELRALAYRKAAQEGGDADAINARYADLLRAPSEDMVQQSRDAARYYTFQKELGVHGRKIQELANGVPGLKIVLPFVRTPINLLKYAGERSVFALAMPEVRAALKAGGRARDEALARITLGSGLSTAAVTAALDGKISGGGPTDPRKRAALLQGGWQPYSVRVGDQWVSYQRFDPFSMLFGAAADFAEVASFATAKEREKFAIHLTAAIAKNVTSKTWLSGLSDFFDMLSDPDRFAPSWFRRLGGSLAVPSLLNQTAQAIDPNLRDARTMADAIRARIPVVSEGLPVRRDVWGEAIERGSSLGPDLVSPIYTTSIKDDPVRKEVARLGVPLSMPQRFIRVDGERVDLTAEQFGEMAQLSGQLAKRYLDEFIGSDEWRSMRDDERVEFVSDTLSEFREAARAALKERHPELGGSSASEPAATRAPPALPPLPPGFTLERQQTSR